MSAGDGLTGTSNQVSQLDRRVVVRNPPDDGLDGPALRASAGANVSTEVCR
jgi:hypothetical protein